MINYCKSADIIGWIGNFGFIIGTTLIAMKYPVEGQLFNIIGNVLYAYVAIKTKLPSLIALSVFLAIINISGVIYWTQ